MIKAERHHWILDRLERDCRIHIMALSNELNTSDNTIRRDLIELNEKGLLIKVHGGAIAKSGLPAGFSDRVDIRLSEKKVMAQKAINLLNTGDVVLIDGGTSNLELVRMLPFDMELTIFTNSFPIVNALFGHKKIEVVFIGGKVFPSSQVTIGVEAIQVLQTFMPDWVILGVSNVHPEKGMTAPDREEALLKAEMLKIARQRIVLCDSQKLNTTAKYLIAPLSEIDYFIVENDEVELIRNDWPSHSFTVL